MKATYIKSLIVVILLSSTLNKVPCAFSDSHSETTGAENDVKSASVTDNATETITPKNEQTLGSLDASVKDSRTSTAPITSNSDSNTTSANPMSSPNDSSTKSTYPMNSNGEGGTVSTTTPQTPPMQSEDIKKTDSPVALPDNPPPEIVKNPLQEKLKSELDEIEKHRATIMSLELQIIEMSISLAQLRAACDKIRGVPFIDSSGAWIALSRMYYYKSFSYGSCKDAINICEWVFRASQPYQAKAFGARAAMLQELWFLADLYYRTGDRTKAEYCCKQFFAMRSEAQVDINNIKVLNNSSGPDPQKEALVKALMPSVNQILAEHKNEKFHMGSINALIYLVQAHINYDKGDYVKSNEYLSKAKAEGMGFGKPIGQMHSANNSKTNRTNSTVNSKTKKK